MKLLQLIGLGFGPLSLGLFLPLLVYLHNQKEFYFNPFQVFPVAILGALAWTAGISLWKKRRPSLALYLGVFYLVTFLGLLGQHQWGWALNSVLWVAGLFLVYSKKQWLLNNADTLLIKNVIAIALFGIYTGFQFSKRAYHPPKARSNLNLAPLQYHRDDRPNIYHLVFDALATDDFLTNADKQTTDALGGFTFYPNHASLFSYTAMAIPSIFSGQGPEKFSNLPLYQHEAYWSENSLIKNLNDRGYNSYAFNYAFPLPNDARKTAFNFVDERDLFLPVHNQDSTFLKLYGATIFPSVLQPYFSGIGPLDKGARTDWCVKRERIVEKQAFDDFLQKEKNLAPSGRYSYLHIRIPHVPYIFDSQCNTRPLLWETNRNEQVGCSLTMIRQFVDELKRLGRYKNSVIILHSDHGYGLTKDSRKRLSSRLTGHNNAKYALTLLSHSQAFLAFKPSGRDSQFQTSQRWVSSLDITPTILKSAGGAIPKAWQGIPLDQSRPSDQISFYHQTQPNGYFSDYENIKYQYDGKSLKKVAVVPMKIR